MMLTNYPLNRELVAERQRKRLEYAERVPRARLGRSPRPTRFSTLRWKLSSWLPDPRPGVAGRSAPGTVPGRRSAHGRRTCHARVGTPSPTQRVEART